MYCIVISFIGALICFGQNYTLRKRYNINFFKIKKKYQGRLIEYIINNFSEDDKILYYHSRFYFRICGIILIITIIIFCVFQYFGI